MVESKFLLSGKVFLTFIRTKKYLSGHPYGFQITDIQTFFVSEL